MRTVGDTHTPQRRSEPRAPFGSRPGSPDTEDARPFPATRQWACTGACAAPGSRRTASRPCSTPREEHEMATAARGASGPGIAAGPTSEFSLFFRVKPGEGAALRAALRELQDTPGYRSGGHGMAISTMHEARV